MTLDSSPLVAVLFAEPGYLDLVDRILEADDVLVGAPTLVETSLVLIGRLFTLQVLQQKNFAVRAFENQVYYVFANSVGHQGKGLWSSGDSKIVGPDSRILALANNRDETVIQAECDLSQAGRQYAREALAQPAFLRAAWKQMLTLCGRQLRLKICR